MRYVADYDKIGLLPLRDHDPEAVMFARSVLYGTTIERRRQESGRYEIKDVGDINCALRVGATTRDIPGYAFAWPMISSHAVAESQSGAPQGPYLRPGGAHNLAPGQTSAAGRAASMAAAGITTRATYTSARYTPSDWHARPVFGGPKYPADPAFATIPQAGRDLPISWPSFPRGYYAVGMAGTEHKSALPVLLSGDPRLVAVNRGSDPTHSTTVVDTDGTGAIDDARHAPLHSHLRVILQPSGMVGFGPRNPLAWNLLGGGADDTAGHGMIYDLAENLEVKTQTVTVTTPTQPSGTPTGPSTITRRTIQAAGPNKPAVAGTSHRVYGPLACGSVADKHIYGTTADGETIGSAHIHCDAYFYRQGMKGEQDYDAPLEFIQQRYPNPGPLPMISRVFLKMDHGKDHPWVAGRQQGLWRWHAETALYVPPTPPRPPPPTTPPSLPPPTLPPPTTTPTEPPYQPPTTRHEDGLPGVLIPASMSRAAGIEALAGGPRRWSPAAGLPLAQHAVPVVDEPPAWTWARARAPTDDAQRYLRAVSEIAAPAHLWIPQALANAPDLRRSPTAPSWLVPQSEDAPVVLREEAWGGRHGGEWTLTRAVTPKYRRTGPGGKYLLPPEVDLSDFGTTYAPEGVSRSTSYAGHAPGVYLGMALPNLLAGGMHTGYRWGHDGAGVTTWEHLDADGAATTVMRMTAAKEWAIRETGGTILTLGGLTDGQFLKRVGSTIVSAAGTGATTESEVVEVAKTSDFAITTADAGTTYCNAGALGQITGTLPAAASPGILVHFVVTDAQYLRVEVDTNPVFYLGDTPTAGATNYLRSNSPGSTLTMVFVDGVWYARAYTGTWEVST